MQSLNKTIFGSLYYNFSNFISSYLNIKKVTLGQRRQIIKFSKHENSQLNYKMKEQKINTKLQKKSVKYKIFEECP